MSKVPSKRNRSFGGCATCRSRRMKCDEARPECNTCLKAGLTCGLYETCLFFESEDGQPKKGRFRRPLLSLQERAHMSERLVASVPPHLALWSLAQVEVQCEEASPLSGQVDVSRGPFGAFRLSTSKSHVVEDVLALTGEAEETAVGDDEHPGSDAAELPHDMPWLDTGDMDFEEASDPLNDNVWGLGSYLDLEPDGELNLNTASGTFVADDTRYQMQSWFVEPHIPRAPSPFAKALSGVSQNACTLLKHYTDTILKSLTPFSHRKTPWHILFMPLVKNCLAGLALQEDLDAASLCVFYGTLTMGSLSLGATSQSESWTRTADTYRRKGRENVLQTLQTAYCSQKTAKYKIQLMAFLTMAQVSIVVGNRDETERFLLEAERLIRIRGLNRTKSRKVRLLHHCYAYERITFESTMHYYGRTANDRQHVRRAIESSGALSYSQDSLSFRFRNSGNLESDMLRLKTREQGENDLHLELAGIWPSTLYPEIFGVPEVYVLLVSMIIRLAREKDSEDDSDDRERLGLKDFTARAKSIENCIKQHRRPLTASENAVGYLVEAVHQAVTIYFYRRIYDVDPSMLLKPVADVCQAVTKYELNNLDKGRGSMRLLWPAFIAASEADDSESRKFFTTWFTHAARQSGLHVFTSSLQNIQQTWENRQTVSNVSVEDFSAMLGEDFFLEELVGGAL